MKYNPAFLDEETLVQSFVARESELRLILEIVQENTGESNQHVLIVGPRGMGKTTLALRIVAETQMDEALSDAWYPIVFGEESYQVTTPGEFWLEALFHLGEQTGESRWQESYEELRRESEEERLCQRALAQLMDFADEREKRILLVAENLNMLFGDQVGSDDAWTLRHTLLNEPRLMLLGTATSRFEEIKEYGKPMYELFKIVDLDPLDDGEIRALWESVTGEEPAQNEVRPIQILTGGNPRLIRIISEFAADTSFRDLMENLTQLVDEHTEYFKRHLDSLSPQERKVFVALADLWDPATTREVAEAARLDTNRTSAVLGRLKDRGAVTVVGKQGRAKQYQVAERMYNIYHLMRRRGQAASRVRAVVRFMIHLYHGEELVDTVAAIAEEAQELAPERREEHFRAYEAVVSMTQDPELEAQIIQEAGPMFSALPDAPQSVEKLTPSGRAGVQGEDTEMDEEKRETLLNVDLDEIREVETLISVGRLHSENSNFDEAILAYEKVLDIEPDNTRALMAVGHIAARKSNHLKALDAFERVLAINPSFRRAWYGKGLALWSLGRNEKALEAFERIVSIDETDVNSLGAKGALLWELDRYEEALDVLDRALQLDDPPSWVWSARGLALQELDRFEEALDAYAKALELDGSNVEIWYFRTDLLEEIGRYEEALHSYNQILELDESDTAAWRGKGFVLAHLNRPEEAVKAFERALSLNESDVRALQGKGFVLLDLKQYRESLKTLNRALEYDETDVGSWYGKGVALAQLGRYEEASEAFERTLQLDESISHAWYNKGVTLERAKRYKEAAEAVQRAVNLGYDREAAYGFLLDLYAIYLNESDEALDVAKSYLEVSGGSPSTLNDISWTFFQAGWSEHLSKAEAWIRRAIEQEPDDEHYHHTLASILGAQDEWEEALDHASVYLEDPDVVSKTLDDAIDFFVAAAAAGHTEEALQCIQNSPSTEALEPMVVALQKDRGEDVTVATEIAEVASDVLDRIEERREERNE